ncbi:MAG: hypothetical protein ACOZDY_00795 [Pseudomonadota bacterium]
MPLHCGASGLLFLSLMPAAKRRRLLTAAPLEKHTELGARAAARRGRHLQAAGGLIRPDAPERRVPPRAAG